MSLWNKLVKLGQEVLQGEKPVKNKLNLDASFLEELANYFGLAMEADPALCMSLTRYIVDGTDEEALLQLGGSTIVAEKLGYGGQYATQQLAFHRRSAITLTEAELPAQVWLRYAHFLAAGNRVLSKAVQPTSAAVYPDWLSALGTAASEAVSGRGGNKATPRLWPMSRFEAILELAAEPTDLLVPALLQTDQGITFASKRFYYYASSFQAFSECADYCTRHAAKVRESIMNASSEQRELALKALSQYKFDFSIMPELLGQLATGSSKSVREAALPFVNANRDTMRPILETILRQGGASERHEAVSTMWRVYGKECIPQFNALLQTEKAERIKQTIQKFIAAPEASSGQSIDSLAIDPIEVELGSFPLSDTTKDHIRQHIQRGYNEKQRQYQQLLKQWEAPNRPQWLRQAPVQAEPLTTADEAKIFDFIENGKSLPPFDTQTDHILRLAGAPTGEWLRPPELKLVHVVRLMHVLRLLLLNGKFLWISSAASLDSYRSQCPKPFGLRELDVAVASLPGFPLGTVANSYLKNNNKWHSFCDWEPEAIWPIFVEHSAVLKEVFFPTQGTQQFHWDSQAQRLNAFRVLAMFPQVPEEFMGILWDLALAEGKTDRPCAQAALYSVPNKTAKILVSLEDGKAGVRAAAGEWLGEIGDGNAIEPLKKAFKKEKNELVKGAFMQALDALHANVDEFLDRNKLLDEAKSNLSKKRPKGTEWISADNLPKLHWQDSGKQLDSQIVEWWIVQSIQQKSPTCGPIIKRYLSMCRDKDVTSLATWALSTWIAQDTATLSSELAAEKARQEADRLWPIYSVHKYYTDHFKNDKENLYKELYSKFSTDFVGSAIEQKGMLALAAAGGDADTVKACEKYIRTYFGNKLSQCKSLIDVLACLDNPLALQSLLSIANRFRTKAIKQHAQEQVQAVAEAKGWTIEELADRTIPDGGFERPVDDNGDPIGDKAVLELDYGPRQFIVQLNEQLEPIISAKGESKALKALPSPGKSDDPEKAAEAKKAFTDAKKIAKEVVKRQSERLYEALCTQRAWRFHDWLRFLAQHPIVGSLCTRLVWAAFSVPTKGQTTEDHDSKTARQLISCFRPLEDGSLTNENDESVSLTDDALVYLAHTCNISAELGEKWTKHFEDYDVTALFQQFGRSTYELPENLRNSTEITDFEGHSISTFKLRGKATKLAYVRGEAEDGGCFCVYRKSFASLGIQTVLEFTGSFLPEQDISAALINLHFLKLQEGKPGAEWQASKLPLGKIPPVLLSECYNDLKQIAAEGAGFDPDWRAKSYF